MAEIFNLFILLDKKKRTNAIDEIFDLVYYKTNKHEN
jgi:hypothetical protein